MGAGKHSVTFVSHLRAWKLESLCGNWRLSCLQCLGLEVGCGHWLQLRWLWRWGIAIVPFPYHFASIFGGAVLAIPIPARIVMMMIVMVVGWGEPFGDDNGFPDLLPARHPDFLPAGYPDLLPCLLPFQFVVPDLFLGWFPILLPRFLPLQFFFWHPNLFLSWLPDFLPVRLPDNLLLPQIVASIFPALVILAQILFARYTNLEGEDRNG